MGQLFIISTPIGNLEDISFRAINCLKEVNVVFSENPATSKKLFLKYSISTRLRKYNQHSTHSLLKEILELLRSDKKLALISEAGTPGISDPGSLLISQIRQELPETEIIPIPGASALGALLSVSGLGTDKFLFLGFLPHKKGRLKLLKEIAICKYSLVLYESKHRFLKLLKELKEQGLADREVLVGREMTKLNESFYFNTVSVLEEYFINNPIETKGEFSLIIKKKHK